MLFGVGLTIYYKATGVLYCCWLAWLADVGKRNWDGYTNVFC